MKRLLTVILASLLLASCSTEDEATVIDGLYKCDTSAFIIYVRVREGKASSITIDDGSRQCVWDGIRTAGSYPDYTYTLDGFTASFHYRSATVAVAALDGVLTDGQTDGPYLNTISYVFDNQSANFQQIKNDI